jgi:hypothetical protein
VGDEWGRTRYTSHRLDQTVPGSGSTSLRASSWIHDKKLAMYLVMLLTLDKPSCQSARERKEPAFVLLKATPSAR